MKLSRESCASLTAFGVCVAAAGGFVVARELNPNEPAPQPAEFTVRSFTYDSSRHLGEVMAAETFTKPTTNALAASAMEAVLQYSEHEFAVYFPSVPESVRDGNFACHVIDSSHQARHYDLFCIASAAASAGAGV